MKIHQKWIILLLCLVTFVKPLALYGKHHSRAKNGPFLVYDVGYFGMFAVFSAVLGALNFYEKKSYAGIKIDLCNGFYLDPERGPNWWNYFFEPINIGDENALHYTFNLANHLVFADKGFHMPRHRAFELIQRYVHVKQHIQNKVDAFVQANFTEYFAIGVHHRGTDKVIEMPLVSYEKTWATLNGVIGGLTQNQKDKLKIYIATDDANFLRYMVIYIPFPVVYNDFVRSEDNTPLHYGNDSRYHNNYQKGEEALIDCLLLSKCNFLIRPWSSLSIMADHFNPNMPVIAIWRKFRIN